MGAKVVREDLLLSKSFYEPLEPKRSACQGRLKAVCSEGSDRRPLTHKRRTLSSPPSHNEALGPLKA